jgi:hypothetical protein
VPQAEAAGGHRFLDSDDLSEVRFEAELAGVGQLWRTLKPIFPR